MDDCGKPTSASAVASRNAINNGLLVIDCDTRRWTRY
jgi:hypothetical protein